MAQQPLKAKQALRKYLGCTSVRKIKREYNFNYIQEITCRKINDA